MKIKSKIFLAPMEEVNDVAFRLLCKKAGSGLTFTGMIHPQTHQKLDLNDKPILQLFCTNSKGIKEFMKKYDKKVSGWDFNLGCPAKTARRHGFGSYLGDLAAIEKILKEMRKHTKKPLSIKLRKSKISYKILELAEKYCDWICIHPRTQGQGYGGKADLEFALEFKKKSKIPVIYSGDIKTKKEAESRLKQFDYVMVGRAAMGNPGWFGKKKFTFKDYLKLAEKYNFPFRQLKFQAMCFTKGMNKAKEKRLEIFKMKSEKEIRKFYENQTTQSKD